jgi:flagellar basal-body rod modification protein FlgD
MSPIPSSSNSGAAPSSGASSTTNSAVVDKNMFLKLMVAQLQNQNPLQPTDGTQFVTQLAQYQQLEQTVNTGQDVSAIRQDVDSALAAYTEASNQS